MKKILLLLSLLYSSFSYSQNLTSGAQCDSLNTLYSYTYLNHGAMFDVVAKTDNVTLDHLDANIKNGTIVYYIYYKTGSFQGFEQNPAAWTLIDSMSVTSNNTLTINNEPTLIPIDLNLNLNQGDTVALYLEAMVLAKVYLTSTTIPWGTEYVSDTAISISVARSIYQSFNVPFSTPQIWNGSVSYCVQGTVGIEDQKRSEDAFILYQHSDQLNFEFSQELVSTNQNLSLSIIDMLSRSVYNYKVNSSKLTINTSELPGGIYVCSLSSDKSRVKEQKIVIR